MDGYDEPLESYEQMSDERAAAERKTPARSGGDVCSECGTRCNICYERSIPAPDFLRDWWEGKMPCPHQATVSVLSKDCFICLQSLFYYPRAAAASTESSDRERAHHFVYIKSFWNSRKEQEEFLAAEFASVRAAALTQPCTNANSAVIEIERLQAELAARPSVEADEIIERCAVEAAIAEKGNLHYECKAATAIRKLKGTFNLRGMAPMTRAALAEKTQP